MSFLPASTSGAIILEDVRQHHSRFGVIVFSFRATIGFPLTVKAKICQINSTCEEYSISPRRSATDYELPTNLVGSCHLTLTASFTSSQYEESTKVLITIGEWKPT